MGISNNTKAAPVNTQAATTPTDKAPVDSSSGGFTKYRCKNFYTHDCQNWVWVNKAACASCLAAGLT
jgi:hypothetical protein